MAVFNSKFNNLDDLLVNQLEDLYDAEKRLTNALPKLAKAAKSPELAAAFRDHLGETTEQIERLDQVFKMIGKSPKHETCEAMKGLLKEGENMIDAKGDDNVRDAALIAAAQRVEHYEMAGYGTARSFAKRLGHEDAASLLQKTLDEEVAADRKLTGIAEKVANPAAVRR